MTTHELNAERIESTLREIFPSLSELEGKLLWGIFRNANVYDKDGKRLGGSFRYNGARIAAVTGIGDYLTYYCSDSFVKMAMAAIGADPQPIIDGLTKRLTDAGVTITPIP